jgi:hypothetical protein
LSEGQKLLLKLVILWLTPLLFVLLAFFVIDLITYFPHARNLNVTTLLNVYRFTLVTSPLWAVFGFVFVLVFGGLFVSDILSAMSRIKFITKGFVITPKGELERVAKNKPKLSFDMGLFLKIFGITLGLNFLYVMFLLRYLTPRPSSNPISSTQGELVSLGAAVQSVLENGQGGLLFFLIALIISVVVLPLLSFAIPFLNGAIKARQIDNRLFHWYWLGLVFSVTGGLSLAAFLYYAVETISFKLVIIDISILLFVAFVFAAISWYSAIGMNFAIPFSQKYLAVLLLKLDGKKGIYFGNVWVGESLQEAKVV